MFIFERPVSVQLLRKKRRSIVSLCPGLNFSTRPFHALQLQGQDPRRSLVEPSAEFRGLEAGTHLPALHAPSASL